MSRTRRAPVPSSVGRRALLALLVPVLAACSADAIEEPAPAVDQAGTFIAMQESADHFRLYRVTNSLRFDPQHTYLFLDEHPPGASSLAEARARAKDPDLPLVSAGVVLLQNFVTTAYTVVWHRSLRDDERD